jgi:hypothetical protein
MPCVYEYVEAHEMLKSLSTERHSGPSVDKRLMLETRLKEGAEVAE